MQLTINGVVTDVADHVAVDVLVHDRVDGPGRVAVAVNAAVVPRSLWEATRLEPGDSVELLAATAGG